MGISYPQIKLSATKSAFRDLLNNAQETFKEDGISIFGEGYSSVISDTDTFSRYRDVMLEGCEANDAEEISQILDNSRWETLNESVSGVTPISSLSVPAIRMLWPRLALKNAIPTEVVKAPKFSLSYIIPYLKVNGKKYPLPRGMLDPTNDVDDTTAKMGQPLFQGWIAVNAAATTDTGTAPVIGNDLPADYVPSARKPGGFDLLFPLVDKSTGKVTSGGLKEEGTLWDTVDPDFTIKAVKVPFKVNPAQEAQEAQPAQGNVGDPDYKPAQEAQEASDASITLGSGDYYMSLNVYVKCELRGSISYDLARRVSVAGLKNGSIKIYKTATDELVTTDKIEELGLFNELPDSTTILVADTLLGKVNFGQGAGAAHDPVMRPNLKLVSSMDVVAAVKVEGRLSMENNNRTESVIFEIQTKDVTIGTGVHIDAPLPNEFLSDVSVLYSIDGVAKVIDILTQTIALRLDNEIRDYIIKGYDRQTDRAGMELFHGFFNCRPDDRYNGTPKDWREMIKLTIDFNANILKQRNYFQGGKFIIVGNPVDCAIIPNASWSFTGSTTERSGIEVDYDIGAISGSQRYEVISSQLVPAGSLYILYVSSQDEQMTYKYYPYSFLVTRDMRNQDQLLIPNITMCKRHKLEYFHDAMIKIDIANNDGSTSWQSATYHLTGGEPVGGTPTAPNSQIFNPPANLV